jgi:hypothetical protein
VAMALPRPVRRKPGALLHWPGSASDHSADRT